MDDGDVCDRGPRQDDEDVAAVAVAVALVGRGVAAEVAEGRLTRCGKAGSVADTAHSVCNLVMAHVSLSGGPFAGHRVVGVSVRDVLSAGFVFVGTKFSGSLIRESLSGTSRVTCTCVGRVIHNGVVGRSAILACTALMMSPHSPLSAIYTFLSILIAGIHH